MTALTTLYAAHKYMCPGLAKQVVSYLKENLTDKNVLLVLQHICLYCSGTDESSEDSANFWDVPITKSPTKSASKTAETAIDIAPSAPPATDVEDEPLLDDSGWASQPTEDDVRDFEAGMVVGTGRGGRQKVNCCQTLLKQCLDLIDEEATAVLVSEDFEDLDISALNMIVCRDTLCVKSEMEVFAALQRWSNRECRRQRLELTPSNRRKVLEGAQYLVRYLTMNHEEFVNGPYRSGILCKEEEEALLSQISRKGTAHATAAAVNLPDHLWQWQSIMRTKRRGKSPPHGIAMSTKKFASGMSRKKRNQKLYKQEKRRKARELKPPTNPKEKFNIVEEFFICLACIFDWKWLWSISFLQQKCFPFSSPPKTHISFESGFFYDVTKKGGKFEFSLSNPVVVILGF